MITTWSNEPPRVLFPIPVWLGGVRQRSVGPVGTIRLPFQNNSRLATFLRYLPPRHSKCILRRKQLLRSTESSTNPCSWAILPKDQTSGRLPLSFVSNPSAHRLRARMLPPKSCPCASAGHSSPNRILPPSVHPPEPIVERSASRRSKVSDWMVARNQVQGHSNQDFELHRWKMGLSRPASREP